MFVVAELRSIFLNNYFNLMFSVGMKIQSILTIAVYDKVKAFTRKFLKKMETKFYTISKK